MTVSLIFILEQLLNNEIDLQMRVIVVYFRRNDGKSMAPLLCHFRCSRCNHRSCPGRHFPSGLSCNFKLCKSSHFYFISIIIHTCIHCNCLPRKCLSIQFVNSFDIQLQTINYSFDYLSIILQLEWICDYDFKFRKLTLNFIYLLTQMSNLVAQIASWYCCILINSS